MNNNLLPRLGTFFILVGCGVLILFIGATFAKEFSHLILYLLIAVVAFILGFGLRHSAPRPEPTRFSSIRKARQRSRQRREDDQAQEDQKK